MYFVFEVQRVSRDNEARSASTWTLQDSAVRVDGRAFLTSYHREESDFVREHLSVPRSCVVKILVYAAIMLFSCPSLTCCFYFFDLRSALAIRRAGSRLSSEIWEDAAVGLNLSPDLKLVLRPVLELAFWLCSLLRKAGSLVVLPFARHPAGFLFGAFEHNFWYV